MKNWCKRLLEQYRCWKFCISAPDALYGVSEEWDAELNNLLDNHQFMFEDPFKQTQHGLPMTAWLGDRQIWLSNHPYCSFTPRVTSLLSADMQSPSKKTIWRAYKKAKNDLKNAQFLSRLTKIS